MNRELAFNTLVGNGQQQRRIQLAYHIRSGGGPHLYTAMGNAKRRNVFLAYIGIWQTCIDTLNQSFIP